MLARKIIITKGVWDDSPSVELWILFLLIQGSCDGYSGSIHLLWENRQHHWGSQQEYKSLRPRTAFCNVRLRISFLSKASRDNFCYDLLLGRDIRVTWLHGPKLGIKNRRLLQECYCPQSHTSPTKYYLLNLSCKLHWPLLDWTVVHNIPPASQRVIWNWLAIRKTIPFLLDTRA